MIATLVIVTRQMWRKKRLDLNILFSRRSWKQELMAIGHCASQLLHPFSNMTILVYLIYFSFSFHMKICLLELQSPKEKRRVRILDSEITFDVTTLMVITGDLGTTRLSVLDQVYLVTPNPLKKYGELCQLIVFLVGDIFSNLSIHNRHNLATYIYIYIYITLAKLCRL